MTEGPDLGTDAFFADERVVLGNRSVRIEANDLAEQAVHLLGLHAAFGDRAFTLRDEQSAVAIPHQSATVMQRRHERRRLMVNHLHVLDLRRRAVHELATRNCGVVGAAFTRLGVAPVDQLVLLVRRIERDVEQSTLTPRIDHRQTGDRLRHRLAIGADDAQATWTLGDEHATVGEPRHAPWVDKTFGHRDNVEGDIELLFGRTVLTGERRLLVWCIGWALVQSVFGAASRRSETTTAATTTWRSCRCAWRRRCRLLRREVKSRTKHEGNSC